MAQRWLFGDQLGPHFTDDLTDDDTVVVVESKAVFRRRRFHRQKAHLVLSAMRHRAAELGDRCTYVRSDHYRSAITGPTTVSHPTSRAALTFVRSMPEVEVLQPRGFATSFEDFRRWAAGRGQKRLLLEDFYRDTRRRLGVLMDGAEPTGGQWNFDHDNRERPPKSRRLDVAPPFWPEEDEIDDEVRHDLDRWERDGDVSFLGADGPRRFAATHAEAQAALRQFIEHRLATFGRYEDAMLADDPWMAHSLLSAPLNLGLLDPLDVVHTAEDAYRQGRAPIAATEGFVRQVIGWREYVWHLYWRQDESYRHGNALQAEADLPEWLAELDADAVQAHCLSTVLGQVRDHGWVHHIPRLMVLGNYALQRGIQPEAMTDWFHRSFVDGYDWVMVPNVVGMSLHADGGTMATKPYASGGAYIDRMSDFCGSCRFDPRVRVGDTACPFTAGYWSFIDRHRDAFVRNHRMRQAVAGLSRLKDLPAVVEQENARGTGAP